MSNYTEIIPYICHIKNIACGYRPENWCKECPKRAALRDIMEIRESEKKRLKVI